MDLLNSQILDKNLVATLEVLGTITYGLKEKFYAFDDLKLDGKIKSKKIGLTEEDFSLFKGN